MKKLVIYVHGKGGNADEALHYKSLFPDADVLGFDYKAETPWDAKKEFPVYFDSFAADYDEVILIANSIGAFFSMNALADKPIKQAYFISPMVNLEKLICNMMMWAGSPKRNFAKRKPFRRISVKRSRGNTCATCVKIRLNGVSRRKSCMVRMII